MNHEMENSFNVSPDNDGSPLVLISQKITV